MTGKPYPTSRGMIPMAGNPHCIQARSNFPMAGNPNVMTIAVTPVTLDPNVRSARCNSNDLLAGCRRGFTDDDFPSPRGSNDRFISLPGMTPRQQKASQCNHSQDPNCFPFHTIILLFRADFPGLNRAPP